eukprot:scaffold34615_cov180-Amphora_coffeaeformis.AAC.4
MVQYCTAAAATPPHYLRSSRASSTTAATTLPYHTTIIEDHAMIDMNLVAPTCGRTFEPMMAIFF